MLELTKVTKVKLHLNGSIIKPVSCVKFLGVTIDEDLTWSPHIENLKSLGRNLPVRVASPGSITN